MPGLVADAAELALGAHRAVGRERRLLVLGRIVDAVAAPPPGRRVADRAALDALERDGHVAALGVLAVRPFAHGTNYGDRERAAPLAIWAVSRSHPTTLAGWP